MNLSISMSHRETALGWVYLLISLFALPLLLALGNEYLSKPLTEAELNIVFFVTNFLGTVLIFRKFLGKSLRLALKNPWRCLRYAAIGFGLYYIVMFLVSEGILYIKPDFANVNDAALMELTQQKLSAMTVCTVLLVPVTEEVLYRGLFFQGLHRRSRVAAYLCSVLAFSSIHVVAYIGMFDWITLLLCFVQYIPAGIALAWAYEKSDTIITPILIHMTVNQIGISAMR